MKLRTYFAKLAIGRVRLVEGVLLGAAQFFIPLAHAQTITINNPQEINDKILCPIGYWMFVILVGLSTIMILYAAFMYVTAEGDEKKVGDATKTITYAAVGVAVALIAKAFPNIVSSIVGGGSVRGCA